MPDRFDDLMREKLGGLHVPSGPGSGAGRDADMEADWSAMAERLDAVEAARGRKSDSRIGLLLFACIIAGSIGLGLWYQMDGRSPFQSGVSEQQMSTADQATAAAPGQAAGASNTGRAAADGSSSPAGADAETAADVAAARFSPSGENGSDPAMVNSGGMPASGQRSSGMPAASSGNPKGPAGDQANTQAGMHPTAGTQAHSPSASRAARATNVAGAKMAPNNSTFQDQNSTQTARENRVNEGRVNGIDAAGEDKRLTAAEAQNPAAPVAKSTADRRGATETFDAPRTSTVPARSLSDLAAFQVWPVPVNPIAAQAGPYLEPEPRSPLSNGDLGSRDPSLQKPPLRYTLTFGPDLNAAITGVGDAIKPSWDLSLSGEVWFPKQVFISAGLRYGMYRFHKVNVQCGNHEAHGVSDHVHCPDAMTGNQALWEIPLRVGYGMDVAKGKGRLRAFAGVSARVQRAADYAVEFHNVGAGDTLFFDPVVITVAETGNFAQAASYSYDTDVLESMANASNSLVADPATSSSDDALSTSTRRTSLALEFGIGYEQFLAPNFSLGVEPRLALPLQSLPMNNGRAYHVAAGALLRWYPGR